MLKYIKSIFCKKPIVYHVCEFKCKSYCCHYNIISEIKDSINNPTWHHFPDQSVLKEWLAKGYDYAMMFQSHWVCSCGKSKTFFFLDKPFKINHNVSRRLTEEETSITQNTWDEMIKRNPLQLGSSRGTSLQETVNILCDELCPHLDKKERYIPTFID